MDRFVAMLLLFLVAVALLLLLLAFFAAAPILCTVFLALSYTLYLFVVHESAGVHHAQEYENRFWTMFSIVLFTALFFASDSPLSIGLWSPSLGFLSVLTCAGATHFYDRHRHRIEISREHGLALRRTATANSSLTKLNHLGQIPVGEMLEVINDNLSGIDQALIPSTINNLINLGRIIKRECDIISVFEEADPKALNYLTTHVKLGLLFYKIKDHRNFGGQNRTKMIELLAVHRLSALNVLSRVVVLHALQIMKFSANVKAEYWVRNIFLKTYQDELSDLKTLNDAKGNYFSMNKLIFEDLRSESIRQDILRHFQKQAATQQAHVKMGTKRSKMRYKERGAWRKILSDVDDTLTCSGGSYPAGIDRRYAKKTLYPGVLAFYEELDLGTQGPDEWPSHRPGNLVFLSARPHVYKDMSEKQSFAKFQKLRQRGMHTMPSLLAGDMKSGGAFMLNQDMEPLAQKKFHNFSNYVQIYPEFSHVFIGDNGQGDVRAGELMHLHYRDKLEQLYVHVVQDLHLTYGYAPERYRKHGLKPCFFRTYPDAAIHAATRPTTEGGPLIKMSGLRRVCLGSINDFHHIPTKHWHSPLQKYRRREELNQGLWRANQVLINYNKETQRSYGSRADKESSSSSSTEPVELIPTEQTWKIGERVRTPYGIGIIRSFTPIFDMYEIDIDWRSLADQVADSERNHEQQVPTSSSPAEHNKQQQHQIKIKIEIEEPGASVQSADGSSSTATSTTCSTSKSSSDSSTSTSKSSSVGTGGSSKGSGSSSSSSNTKPSLTKEVPASSVRVLETVVETSEIDEDAYNNGNSGNGFDNNHRQDLHIEVTLGANGTATATAIPPSSSSLGRSSLPRHHPRYSSSSSLSTNNNNDPSWDSTGMMQRQDSDATLVSDNVSPTSAAKASHHSDVGGTSSRTKSATTASTNRTTTTTTRSLGGTSTTTTTDASSVASSTTHGAASGWSIGGDADNSSYNSNSYYGSQWDDNMSMSSFPSIGSLPSEYKKDYYQPYASSSSIVSSSLPQPLGPDSLMHLPSFGDESSSGVLTPRRNSKEDNSASNNAPMEKETETEKQQEKDDNAPTSTIKLEYGFARARIQGRHITKYVPPKLPRLATAPALEKKGSIFSFFGTSTADGGSTSTSSTTTTKPSFTTGQSVRTPFGTAHVIKERIDKDGMVVVKMQGWKATAYLNKDSVTVNEKGFLNSFFRSLVVASEISPVKSKKSATSTTAPEKRSSAAAPAPEEQPFPKGTIIPTPYGKGTLVQPLVPPSPTIEPTNATPSTTIQVGPSPTSIDAAKAAASAALLAAAPMMPELSSSKNTVSVSLAEKKRKEDDETDAPVDSIDKTLKDDRSKDEVAPAAPPIEAIEDETPKASGKTILPEREEDKPTLQPIASLSPSSSPAAAAVEESTEVLHDAAVDAPPSTTVSERQAEAETEAEATTTTMTTTTTTTTSAPPLVFADDVTKQFTITAVRTPQGTNDTSETKHITSSSDQTDDTVDNKEDMTSVNTNTNGISMEENKTPTEENIVTIKVALPEKVVQPEVYETIGICLDDWTLANGKHPIVYCTPETAKEWKDKLSSQRGSEGGYILSTLTSLVRRIRSSSIATAVGTTSAADEQSSSKKKPSLEPPPAAPQIEQYYKDGAAVDTLYGNGRVCSFRPSYGFYVIELTQWTLANGQHPKAYLTKDLISHRMAKECQEGGSVLTNFGGMSGTLASVEPTTGVHVVTIPRLHMVCYLQPDSIVMPLKAAVGDTVVTPYGEGKVVKFRQEDRMYQVQLLAGDDNQGATTRATTTLYCQAEYLTRVDDEAHTGKGNSHHGAFGMDWFLRILTFNAFGGGTTAAAPPAATTNPGSIRPHHSRSSSVASVQPSTSTAPTGGRRKSSFAE